MSDGLFGDRRTSDGTLIATFHAVSVEDLPNDFKSQPQGIRFVIIRGDNNDKDASFNGPCVHGGILLLEPERLQILGNLVPGVGWTALNVKPQIIEHSDPLLCLLDLTVQGSGSIIRHAKGSLDPITVDICAGIGGWHFGGRPFNVRPAISIEIDEQVAEILCANHHLQMFTPERFASATFPELTMWTKTGLVVNADFCDEKFWEHLAHCGVSVFFASLPCPPWSRLTGANGLGDVRGQLFQKFAFMMNVFRPIVVALENLPGLTTHPDWGCILKSFETVGFELSHESVDSLSHVLPMSRDRVSLIFTNMSHASELTCSKLRAFPMPTMVLNPDPRHLGVYHDEEPTQVLIATTIAPCQEELLSNPEMWPRHWKITKPIVNHRISLEDRIISKHTIMPCAVAKYAQPEAINPRLLTEKGLVMRLTQSPYGPRWFSPIEIQSALGLPLTFLHSRTDQLAYHVLGNSISPAHAAATIARVIALYPKLCAAPITLEALGSILSQVPRYPLDESFYWTVPKTSVQRPLREYTHPVTKLNPLADAFVKGSVASIVNTVQPTMIDTQTTLNDLTGENKDESPKTSFDRFLDFVCLEGNSSVFRIRSPSSCCIDHAEHDSINLWVSGFSPRGCSQNLSWNVTISDSLGSWTSHLLVEGELTVSTVVKSASPDIESFHCEALVANGLTIDWDDFMPLGNLVITSEKRFV